jgi:hypothetical protein
MNKDLWTFNEKGTASYDNDANDYYYYSWVDLDVADKNIRDLFQEFLGVSYSDVKVRVKARKGAIFIVVDGDKDDTPNPS